MNKKDALEIRRRFTKETSIDRVAGCYVDCNKNIVVKFAESFYNLAEEEFYKYLEIAKKTMTGSVGNNLLELDFLADEAETGGKREFLWELKKSGLKDEEMLDRLYESIISNYEYTGNYIILAFHDRYDIMKKTSDNIEIDESEELYEYVLVSICPVELSKPALGYRADENRIGARVRDWIVEAPEIGFLYPAFDRRSSDANRIDFFIRDPKNPHPEFVEDVMGCNTRRTAYEQRQTLEQIVSRAYRDEDDAKEVLLDIEESFKLKTDRAESEGIDAEEPIVLSGDIIDEVIEENELDEERGGIIKEHILKEFADEMPEISNLVDARALKANEPVKREKQLLKEVIELKNRLENTSGEGKADIVITVSPEKAGSVKAEYINDGRYLVIPLDDYENASVNGRMLDCDT